MERINLNDAYKFPADYKPPPFNLLTGNTNYPNLNSIEYQLKTIDLERKVYPFLETVDINQKGQVLIGCNDYIGRCWNGSFWGYQTVDNIFDKDKSTFCYSNYENESTIVAAKFLSSDIIVAAYTSGKIAVGALSHGMGSEQLPLLNKIAERSEHSSSLTAFSLIGSYNNRMVSGTNDGCLKLWDFSETDLYSVNSYRFGHSDKISGVVGDQHSSDIFITCSYDREAVLWDTRISFPATVLYDNHDCALETVQWNREREPDLNKIYLGDESGSLFVLDRRSPKKIIKSCKPYNRAMHKLILKNDKLAAIGKTNEIKIFKMINDEFELIFHNDKATNFIRDLLWIDENEFIAIGWDNYHMKHKLVI